MAEIVQSCPDCGGALRSVFGSRNLNGRLCWSASHRCRDCDSAVEEDDWDSIPERYRQLELEQDGIYAIRISDEVASKAQLMNVIRRVTNEPYSELALIKSQLPGPILNGTRAEMDRVAFHLAEAGIGSTVVSTSEMLDSRQASSDN